MDKNKLNYIKMLLENNFNRDNINHKLKVNPELRNLYNYDKEVKEYIDAIITKEN